MSDHSNVISVEPLSLKRVTCSATSSCTQGRSPLNVRSAATPVEDEMHLLAIFALMRVRRIQALHFCIVCGFFFAKVTPNIVFPISLQCPLQLLESHTSAATVVVVTSNRARWKSTVSAATATYRAWSANRQPVLPFQVRVLMASTVQLQPQYCNYQPNEEGLHG